jgi:hypothetical protein
MPAHFTYCERRAGGAEATAAVGTVHADLLQGDVVERTPEINKLLQQVHPHYSIKASNTHFIVLSQDCDLVRRDGSKCDSRYISIAPIRPLRILLNRQLEQYIEKDFDGEIPVCNESSKARYRLFLERLFNNNESGLFYLHRDVTIGLAEDSCAFLALSIAVKADLHYETLRNAVIVGLKDNFRAKLGWLVGHMYSRVGTEDWPKTTLVGLINDMLEQSSVWVENKKLKELKALVREWQAKNSGQKIDRQTIEQLAKQVPKRKERVVSAIVKALVDQKLVGIADKIRIENVIRNDPTISALVPD